MAAKSGKMEIFPSSIVHSCTTLGVKNSLEIALSLMVFEIFTLFHFPQKSKMAAKSGKNWIFLLHRTLLYSPVDQKFARNRSISYGFEIFKLFHFPQKSKMAAKSGKNGKFAPMNSTLSYYPVGQKFARTALSLTDFEIFTLCHFPQKSKMATKSGKNGNFSVFNSTLLYYPWGQKFIRNRSVSYGFRDIHTFLISAKI